MGIPDRVLVEADRCDRCGAQAFVRVSIGFWLLDFCGHHFREHEDEMMFAGYGIIDERWAISRESPSL